MSVMPDANAIRQARHESALTFACPSCGAEADTPCQATVNETAGRRGVPGRRGPHGSEYIGGLHSARWKAWEARSVIMKLGELIE